ncbi:MAG: hypothetical protein JW957_01600, partial [Candidatus Omnitrophica bacterium]|nr:hypothetical protein [Candidatus Omnitrophota bacterium]
LKEIRSINSDVGIIIQTGYGSKETFLNTLWEKADAYIEKPLNIVITRETIERILYRSSKNSSEDTKGIKRTIE